MEVGRVLFGSVILSFLLFLFGPLPVKYLSGNGLYYFSCTLLRFDSSIPSLEMITDLSINLLVVYRESVNLIGYITRRLSADSQQL